MEKPYNNPKTFEVYLEIQKLVEECCGFKCGKAPETESDCKGVDAYVDCPVCHGDGTIQYYRRKRGNWSSECSRCRGEGKVFVKYVCPVRRISDNADYHSTMIQRSYSWKAMLEKDLQKLRETHTDIIKERVREGLPLLFETEANHRERKKTIPGTEEVS